MTFTPDQANELSKPLNRAHVKSRSQSGRSLSYVEGWHVIAEANRIFGFDAWTRETLELRLVNERARKMGKEGRDGWGVSYICRVRVAVNGVVRDGVGSGHGIDADLGQAHESAVKEAETDAMKRALMTFGNPFGLALYDKEQANVADEPSPAERYFEECVVAVSHFENADEISKWWKETKQTRSDLLTVDQRKKLMDMAVEKTRALNAAEAA